MLDAFTLPDGYLMPVLGYVFMVNAVGLALFGLNRANSEDGEWGGAEIRVLLVSLLGGWVGARLGRMMYPAEDEPRSFAAILNLSVLALPLMLATPFLLQAAPGWIAAGYTAYTAQYVADQQAAEAARVSPLGAAYQTKGDAEALDATGVVASADVSPASAIAEAGGKLSAVVTAAAAADAAAALLPKRFGPGSEKKGKKGGIKFLSVGGS